MPTPFTPLSRPRPKCGTCSSFELETSSCIIFHCIPNQHNECCSQYSKAPASNCPQIEKQPPTPQEDPDFSNVGELFHDKTTETTRKVLSEVASERLRQDSMWGEQNHDPFIWLGILGEEKGEADRGAIQARFAGESLDNYREELIHTAAVAVAAIESLDRARAQY